MVTNVTSLGRNGVYDWLVQRLSSLVLLAWVLFLAGWLLAAGELDYAAWSTLFSHTWMKVFTLAALISLCAHAWIGMWTVSTDYFIELTMGPSATIWRLLFQLVCLFVVLFYFVWGIQILWSV